MAQVIPPIVDITINSSTSGQTDNRDHTSALLGLDAADIERVVALTLARAGITLAVELSVVITSDEELRRLNREYRGRDETTDVLSFPLLDTPLAQAPADQLWGGDTLDEGGPSNQDTGRNARATKNEWAAFVAPPTGSVHLGDIVIARDMTVHQAAQAGHAPAWELAYLVAHGVLHLVGYDDHTDAGYAAMVAHQEAALRLAGISR